jgi:hypothetical protein
VLPTFGRNFRPLWRKGLEKRMIKILGTFNLKKLPLEKLYKRGRTFLDIGQTFWLNWPESLDRTW